MSVSLEYLTPTSQKVWREWLPPHPEPPCHEQCSDHHPSNGPKSLHTPESLTGSDMLFTCLDLKDAFFCLRLSPASQPLFDFEWDDPHTGKKTQLTWTRLSQSFRNSPPLFGEHLATDLAAFPGDTLNCIPLQHRGDLVLAGPSQGTAGGTRALMPLLSTTRHKVHGNRIRSADKSPSTSGLSSQKGIGHLDMRGKKPSVQYFGWKPRKQSMSWSCCILLIWRPGFSEIMKPLFIATAGSGKEPLGWKPEQRKAFKEIETLEQRSSIRAARWDTGLYPLCTWTKPHCTEGPHINSWAMACPLAYMSKPLDPVAAGWPPRLRALAATVILAREADKLTLGQNVNVKIPHAVTALKTGHISGWLWGAAEMHPVCDKVMGWERNLQGRSSPRGCPGGLVCLFPLSVSLLGFLLIFGNVIYSNKASLEKSKPIYKCSWLLWLRTLP